MKLKQFAIRKLLIVMTVMSSLVLAPAVVYAIDPPATSTDTKTAVCEGVGIATGGSGCDEGGISINTLIRNIVQWFIILIGSIAVIMIIYGGFRYITSGGDNNATAAAKNTILYAIIGLVIVLFAQAIISFVIKGTEGTSNSSTSATPASRAGSQ